MKQGLRWTYQSVLLLAAPAALWTSFEMYGLTLSSPQMLFYSVTHAYPVIFTVVLLSGLFFLVWAAINVTALLSRSVRTAIDIPTRFVGVFFAYQVAHVAALLLYESWSFVPQLRVAICIAGLTLLTVVITLAALLPNKRFRSTQNASGVLLG